jgi:hypothetical protein
MTRIAQKPKHGTGSSGYGVVLTPDSPRTRPTPIQFGGTDVILAGVVGSAVVARW